MLPGASDTAGRQFAGPNSSHIRLGARNGFRIRTVTQRENKESHGRVLGTVSVLRKRPKRAGGTRGLYVRLRHRSSIIEPPSRCTVQRDYHLARMPSSSLQPQAGPSTSKPFGSALPPPPKITKRKRKQLEELPTSELLHRDEGGPLLSPLTGGVRWR